MEIFLTKFPEFLHLAITRLFCKFYKILIPRINNFDSLDWKKKKTYQLLQNVVGHISRGVTNGEGRGVGEDEGCFAGP